MAIEAVLGVAPSFRTNRSTSYILTAPLTASNKPNQPQTPPTPDSIRGVSTTSNRTEVTITPLPAEKLAEFADLLLMDGTGAERVGRDSRRRGRVFTRSAATATHRSRVR